MKNIIKPLVTEKMNRLTEQNSACYGFVVRPAADKRTLKAEIEQLYGVKVKSINTMRYAGKAKSRYTRSGQVKGRTAAFKKAIVTLQEGQTIDFYSNI